jgi:hypothetical protein
VGERLQPTFQVCRSKSRAAGRCPPVESCGSLCIHLVWLQAAVKDNRRITGRHRRSAGVVIQYIGKAPTRYGEVM